MIFNVISPYRVLEWSLIFIILIILSLIAHWASLHSESHFLQTTTNFQATNLHALCFDELESEKTKTFSNERTSLSSSSA